MLDQSDIAHYLLSLGLVKPREVVERGPRRSSTCRGATASSSPRRAPGATYVVKQASPRSAPTLAHEADVLRVLADMPELAASRPGRRVRGAGRGPARPEHARRRARLDRQPRAPAGSRGSRRGSSAARSRPCTASRRRARPRCRPATIAPGGCRCRSRRTSVLLDMSAGRTGCRGARAGERRGVPPARRAARRVRRRRDRARRPALGQLPGARGRAGAARRTRAAPDRLGAGRRRPRRRSTSARCSPSTCGRGSGRSRSSTRAIPAASPRTPAIRWRGCGPPAGVLVGLRRGTARSPPPLRRVVQLAAVRLLQTRGRARGAASTRASAHVVTLLQLADNMLREPEDAAAVLLGLRA